MQKYFDEKGQTDFMAFNSTMCNEFWEETTQKPINASLFVHHIISKLKEIF